MKVLLTELRGEPLIFDGTRLWVMPKGYESGLALRLDSKIILYEDTGAPSTTLQNGTQVSYVVGCQSKYQRMQKLKSCG